MTMEGKLFLLLTVFLQYHSATSEQESVKLSLILFLQKLTGNITIVQNRLGWTMFSDPCSGRWTGVSCANGTAAVQSIALDGFGFSGSFNPGLACSAPSLAVLSLRNNNLRSGLPADISKCVLLTELNLHGNRLSGPLPPSLGELKNLSRLDVSDNNFSMPVPPTMTNLSGLISFNAAKNQFSGPIPSFDFAKMKEFNVSGNLFSGEIPPGAAKFQNSSFIGNAGLCGSPLSVSCRSEPAAPPPTSAEASEEKKRKKPPTREQALMYSGYILIGFAFVLFVVYKLVKRRKKGDDNGGMKMAMASEKAEEGERLKKESNSNGHKTSGTEYSVSSSVEDAPPSTSLVVLNGAGRRDFRFDDLLKAPAELMGRGKHGSTYRVMFGDGSTLAVKRIKDWSISSEDFQTRMERIGAASHRNVLPVVAFYCSKVEKLVVYEYQQGGSLFDLLRGSQGGQPLDWASRLNIAAGVAQGVAFMHTYLKSPAIPHGNLKLSNILVVASTMDPFVAEYGLLPSDDRHPLSPTSRNVKPPKPAATPTFKTDVYCFGIILLQLLTGKLVETDGFDLAEWVNSVVREEWTVEVFDRVLVGEGASEERMVQLLQVALKCVRKRVDARPTMAQVSTVIGTIKDEEERSLASSEAY